MVFGVLKTPALLHQEQIGDNLISRLCRECSRCRSCQERVCAFQFTSACWWYIFFTIIYYWLYIKYNNKIIKRSIIFFYYHYLYLCIIILLLKYNTRKVKVVRRRIHIINDRKVIKKIISPNTNIIIIYICHNLK